jgi:hypothetical protein
MEIFHYEFYPVDGMLISNTALHLYAHLESNPQCVTPEGYAVAQYDLKQPHS